MQFSENWLRTLVDPTLSSDELAHLLTMAGLEVEELEHIDTNDTRFNVKLTPNRADCLSLLGIAREVSALTGVPLKAIPAHTTASTITQKIDEKLPINIAAPDLCGRFSGRVIRNINAKAETPDWMKQRLECSGQRPISALVDISNYVMLELGRPSHVFDLDKIHGGLTVRWGKAGESITLLNGNTIDLDEWVGVIADEQRIESLAGIMGGEASSVSLDTQNIYFEAAFWWPQAIQGRARRYNFSTDAAHRFERGVDYANTVEHIERITALIVEICGRSGETSVGPIDDQIVNLPQRSAVTVRTARVEKVLGIAFSDEQIAAILTRLNLSFSQHAGSFVVNPPSYRFDIEIEEDLIEEIARIYGFDNIPALPPIAPNQMRAAPENTRSLFAIRHQLADLDYQEVINFSFVEQTWETDLSGNSEPIKLLNPIASQMSVMRSSLIGGLIANARYNLNRKVARVRLFEIGAVYLRDSAMQEGPLSIAGYHQPKRVAALAYGPVVEEQWGQAARNVDYFDVKADIEALFAPHVVRFVKTEHPALHPGRAASIFFNDKNIGFIGELHPLWQQKYDLPLAPILFEIEAFALQERIIPNYQEITKFPAVIRDLAVLVKQTISVQELIDAFEAEKLSNSACHILQSIVLFDEYKGKGLAIDEKSLAFRFMLQDTQSTLQDDAVDAAMTAFVDIAIRKFNAKLRA